MMRKILEIVIDRISVVFSKSENIYKMSKLITEKHDNFSSNMNTNGERKLVEYLSQVLPSDSIIFDIGVNKGEYSKLIQLNFKNPAVYAFDPVKENIEQASKLLSGGVIYITKAVSDYDGEAIFFIHTGQKNSGLSSLYDMNNIGYKTKSEQRSVPVLKIDTFSENQNITSIDFMKIDVEGNELNVLKGAEKMFKNNKIKIVQFEFGHAARASRTLLLDFFNFFDKYNFEIFTVMPYGLNRIKYTPFEENRWHIINFVAIRKDLVDKFNPLIRKE